jgi:hypothetical protein
VWSFYAVLFIHLSTFTLEVPRKPLHRYPRYLQRGYEENSREVTGIPREKLLRALT